MEQQQSPYHIRKREFLERIRSKGPAFKEGIMRAANRERKPRIIKNDEVLESAINYEKIMAELLGKFESLDEELLNPKAELEVRYNVLSNLHNVISGNQMSTHVNENVGGLMDARRTPVLMEGIHGRQKIALGSGAQIISLSEREMYDEIIKAFGWSRNDSINMPDHNRNLAALLRQCHVGVNLCTRIIKLMCYYFIACITGTISFDANDLIRHQVIGYNYTSIGTAAAINDCTYSYCSDPHNGHVMILHLVGMSEFPCNADRGGNNLYNGLVIPQDATHCRLVIPQVSEAGVPPRVEMRAETYLCALNVILSDYQIGDKLVEQLWMVAACLIGHNGTKSITLPRVDSLGLLARPVWNPIYKIPDCVRKIDILHAILLGYTFRATIICGVNTLLSWVIKGKENPDAMNSILIRVVRSHSERNFFYRNLQQCLPSMWAVVVWLDGLRLLDREWLVMTRDKPLLESFWVLEDGNVMAYDSVYSALCYGNLLRRSEDFSSEIGQLGGATGVALGMYTGIIYSSSRSHVTGNGHNIAIRNQLLEGPITVYVQGIRVERDEIKFRSRGRRSRYNISLDKEKLFVYEDEGILSDEESEDEIEITETTETTKSDVQCDELSDIDTPRDNRSIPRRVQVPTPQLRKTETPWKPRTSIMQAREQREIMKETKERQYMGKVVRAGHVTLEESNIDCIRASCKRYFKEDDTDGTSIEMTTRKGLFKMFGTINWRYSGALIDLEKIFNCCLEDHKHWDITKKLIPTFMMNTLEEGIVYAFRMMDRHTVTTKTMQSKCIRLWQAVQYEKIIPEMIILEDDALDECIHALDTLSFKEMPEDKILEWAINLTKENDWKQYM